MITLVGLGVARGDLTLNAVEALMSGEKVLLRTEVTPAADFLREKGVPFETLDDIYEENEDFDEVNDAAAERVIDAARSGGVIYGVPGGAGLMDATVSAVIRRAAEEKLDWRVIPGVGLYERAAAEAGALDGANVLAAIDVTEDTVIDVRRPLVVCEVSDRMAASDLKLSLMEHYPEQWPVYCGGEKLTLDEIDRRKHYDHLTCLVLPPLALEEAEHYDLDHLMQIVTRLRAPGGCPWDREQTHRSMKADLVDETYEVLDAIDRDDPDALADELGDVLLHIAMHAAIGQEHGEFTIRDVLDDVCRKMIRRHPHIFGDVHAETSEEVLQNWEAIKKQEKSLQSQTGVMREVPRSFPALMRAAKVQKKAKNVGFDWDDAKEALKKVREETGEVEEVWDDPEKLFSELGDLLFATVNICRMKKVPPELALQGATEKFIRRFSYVEEHAKMQGRELNGMTLEEMDVLWEECKALERKNP